MDILDQRFISGKFFGTLVIISLSLRNKKFIYDRFGQPN